MEPKNLVVVERVVRARPETIFALISDPARHREFDGSGLVRDAQGPAAPLKIGSRFGMSMRAGLPYSMVSTVIEFEQDRVIAWQTRGPGNMGKIVGGRVWRFELTDNNDGTTLVRESRDISEESSLTRPVIAGSSGRTRRNISRSLGRLARIVEDPSGGSRVASGRSAEGRIPEPAESRTIVVTGASSGIGEEIAYELARRGHGVTLVARSVEKLEAVAEKARSLGVRAEVLPADLALPEDRAGLPDRVAALGLEAVGLINNAGFATSGLVAESDPAAEVSMIQVNCAAVAELCTRFLPGMIGRGEGVVLNVASTGAFQPLPGLAGYGATKAFVLSYTHALIGELRDTGVSASVLCPGPVETGFGEAAGFGADNPLKILPDIMWKDVAEVARAAVAGLDQGKAVIIPGAANQVGALLADATPRALLARILAKQFAQG